MFNPGFGIQAQFFSANLRADRPDVGQYFTGVLSDYSISARVHPLHYMQSVNLGKINPYAALGIATIGYRAVRRDIQTNTVILPAYGYKTDGLTKAPKSNGLAIPITLGVSYEINPKISIEFEHSHRLTNTDDIDATVGTSTLNDMYGFTSVGLKYTFSPASSTPKAVKRPASRPTRTPTRTPTRKTQTDPVDTRTKNANANRNNIYDVPLTNVFIESVVPEVLTSGQTFTVKIRINKGSYIGPGKLSQKYPPGFSAIEAQPGYGIFTFNENTQTVLVDWAQMPSDSIVSYAYFVRTGENVSGNQTIAGRFEYLQPQGWTTNRFNNLVFVENKVEKQMDNNISSLTGLENNEGRKVDNLNENQIETSLDRILGITKTDYNPVIKTQENVVAGVVYRIQCEAFKDPTQGGQRLANKYGIREPLRQEFHKGWYKYTVGEFRSYAKAEKFRDAFINRTKIWSAYIVAYKDGRRLANVNQAVR